MAISWVTLANLTRHAKGREQLETSCSRFNVLYEASWRIMMQLSASVGWQGDYPMGFDGFDGFRVELKADRLRFLRGSEEYGRVEMSPAGDVVVSGDIFRGLSDRQIAERMFDAVMSEDNRSLAINFCTFGRYRITGFMDGLQPYFIDRPLVPGLSDALKAYSLEHYGREPVLLSEFKFNQQLKRVNIGELYIPDVELFGVARRGESPTFIQLDFDGAEVGSLQDMFDVMSMPRQLKPFVEHCSELESLCSEFSHRLVRGCDLINEMDAEGLYHFERARYTMMDGRSESLRVVSRGGEESFVEIVPSHYSESSRAFKVCEGHDGEIRFMSSKDLRSLLEKYVLSKENIAMARRDFIRGGVPIKDAFRNDSKKEESVSFENKLK